LVVPSDTDYVRWSLISNSHLTAGGITLGPTDFLDPYPDASVQIIMLAGFLPYLIDSVIPAAIQNGVKIRWRALVACIWIPVHTRGSVRGLHRRPTRSVQTAFCLALTMAWAVGIEGMSRQRLLRWTKR